MNPENNWVEGGWDESGNASNAEKRSVFFRESRRAIIRIIILLSEMH